MDVDYRGEVLVFDNEMWGGRDVGDNSQFWKRASVLAVRGAGRDRVATVRFHHDGRVSRGHFTSVMRSIASSEKEVSDA